MSWKNFYVYQYVREDGSPFYIGKGSNLGRKNSAERNNKIKESMKNKRWFTNGTDSIFCELGSQPSNYRPGRTMRRVA